MASTCRFDHAPALQKELGEVSVARTMALRYLYGCLTYLDGSDPHSPCGKYPEFLRGLPADIRGNLTTSHVLRFLERACQVDRGQRRVVFTLLDELNACEKESKGNQASLQLLSISAWCKAVQALAISKLPISGCFSGGVQAHWCGS